MNKDPLVFINHILDSITQIQEYSKEVNREQFLHKRIIQDAVLKNLEIIGEATKNIPLEFKEKYQKISWKRIAGLRDILVYQYFRVDKEATWEVIIKDIPKLKKEILSILEHEKEKEI